MPCLDLLSSRRHLPTHSILTSLRIAKDPETRPKAFPFLFDRQAQGTALRKSGKIVRNQRPCENILPSPDYRAILLDLAVSVVTCWCFPLLHLTPQLRQVLPGHPVIEPVLSRNALPEIITLQPH